MVPIVGVYKSFTDAERGVVKLRENDVPESDINVLTPQSTSEQLASVPTVAGEQPGIVTAIGAVAGGAVGLGTGAGLATLLVAGLGPVLAIGAAGGLLLGALAGVTLGNAAENTIGEGLPEEELFIYEDALRQGRTVVVTMAANAVVTKLTHEVYATTGAESIDRAREMWWLGLRDLESEHYEARGGDFKREEKELRRGFEAAQIPENRGKSFDERRSGLSKRYPDTWNTAAFRHGYDRGCQYFKERRKSEASAPRQKMNHG